ncbi:phoE Broad specificity phosphatase PhoE and related phosphatases [Acidimicrobiia bacterium]
MESIKPDQQSQSGSRANGLGSDNQEFAQRVWSLPPGATEIILVRHGQSAAFIESTPFDLVDGQGDPPLSDLGRHQARQVAVRLAELEIAAIYATTLRRTVETASPLAAQLGLEIGIESDLREVHLGEWEGGYFRKMAAEAHPALAQMDATQDWGAIPGAETSASLRSRVRSALTRLHLRHPNERVVAVSHGGAIGAALAEATGATSLAFSATDNASIARLVIVGDRWIVRSYNDTGHLDEGQRPSEQGPT